MQKKQHDFINLADKGMGSALKMETNPLQLWTHALHFLWPSAAPAARPRPRLTMAERPPTTGQLQRGALFTKNASQNDSKIDLKSIPGESEWVIAMPSWKVIRISPSGGGKICFWDHFLLENNVKIGLTSVPGWSKGPLGRPSRKVMIIWPSGRWKNLILEWFLDYFWTWKSFKNPPKNHFKNH